MSLATGDESPLPTASVSDSLTHSLDLRGCLAFGQRVVHGGRVGLGGGKSLSPSGSGGAPPIVDSTTMVR